MLVLSIKIPIQEEQQQGEFVLYIMLHRIYTIYTLFYTMYYVAQQPTSIVDSGFFIPIDPKIISKEYCT